MAMLPYVGLSTRFFSTSLAAVTLRLCSVLLGAGFSPLRIRSSSVYRCHSKALAGGFGFGSFKTKHPLIGSYLDRPAAFIWLFLFVLGAGLLDRHALFGVELVPVGTLSSTLHKSALAARVVD